MSIYRKEPQECVAEIDKSYGDGDGLPKWETTPSNDYYQKTTTRSLKNINNDVTNVASNIKKYLPPQYHQRSIASIILTVLHTYDNKCREPHKNIIDWLTSDYTRYLFYPLSSLLGDDMFQAHGFMIKHSSALIKDNCIALVAIKSKEVSTWENAICALFGLGQPKGAKTRCNMIFLDFPNLRRFLLFNRHRGLTNRHQVRVKALTLKRFRTTA